METEKILLSPAAYRRRRQIEDCLYENLQREPYGSISVSDLCRQVGISRKAYYKYYRDKDDCLCAILDHYLHGAMLCSTQVPDEDPLDCYRVQLEFWKAHKILLDIVVRNGLLPLLVRRSALQICSQDPSVLKLLDTRQVPCDQDILVSYLSGQMAIVLQWYDRDFSDPVDQMAQKLYRICHQPLLINPLGKNSEMY